MSLRLGFLEGFAMRKQKPKVIPIPGDMGHNLGFHTAIGSLVIHWANTESIYMLYLRTLLNQDQHDTAIIWHAQRSTVARLELISKLARSRIDNDSNLLGDVLKSVSLFRGFCNIRNFFCHAVYSYDGEGKLDFAHGITLTRDDYPLNFERKPMDAGTASEIIDAANRLAGFSDECWDLAERLDQHFGTQHVTRPQRPQQTNI